VINSVVSNSISDIISNIYSGEIGSRLIPTFAGSQYGTIDTPITFTGDFEIEVEAVIPDETAGAFQVLTGDNTTGSDYITGVSTGNVEINIAGGTPLNGAPVTINPYDGKIHIWKLSRTGSVGKLEIDGITQLSGTVPTTNSVWVRIAANRATAANFLHGQILSAKFTDAGTVVANYVFDSGSDTVQEPRGGIGPNCTLINFATTDWNRYTQQRNIVHDAGVIGEAWVGDNLVVNGGFNDGSAWTLASNWSISGGKAITDGTIQGSIFQAVLTTNNIYIVSVDINDYVSPDLNIFIGNTNSSPNLTGNGTKKFVGECTAGTQLFMRSEIAADFSIDNVSAQHILEVA